MTLGDRATLGTRGSGGTTGVVGGHGGLGSTIRKTGLDVFAVMPKVGGEVSRDRNSNPNLGMGEHCFTFDVVTAEEQSRRMPSVAYSGTVKGSGLP